MDKSTCLEVERPIDWLTEELVKGGARFFSYRNTTDSPRVQLEEATRLAHVVTSVGGVLVVDDRADIAVASGASGVHLPFDGVPVTAARALPGIRRVGCSCHGATEVTLAEQTGADYVILSPVFEATRADATARSPIGALALASMIREVNVPVFALGGINAGRVAQCMVAGVYGIAVLGSVLLADDPVKEFQLLDEIVTVALRGASKR